MSEYKAIERRSVRRRSAKVVAERQAPGSASWTHKWWDEVGAILAFTLAVFVGLSLGSFYWGGAELSRNLLGVAGDRTARWLYDYFGYCSFALSLFLFGGSLLLWRLDRLEERHKSSLTALLFRVFGAVAGFAGFTLAGAGLATVMFGLKGGGRVGSVIALPLIEVFSPFGAALFSVLFMFFFSAVALGSSVLSILRVTTTRILVLLGMLLALPVVVFKFAGWCCGKLYLALKCLSAIVTNLRSKSGTLDNYTGSATYGGGRKISGSSSAESGFLKEPLADNARLQNAEDSASGEVPSTEEPVEKPSHVVVLRARRESASTQRKFVRPPESPPHAEESDAGDSDMSGYVPPSLDLLTPGEPGQSNEGDAELLDKSRQIEGKLRDFGIDGRVTQVHQGPVITLFEFEPAAGVKVGRIAALQDDLAMSLRASSIRIVAPIPRRGTVGIEVPNKNRDVVRLRDVLESNSFVHSDSLLNVCVGKDTYGDPVVADISLMPHLLIAGATGTGKSVCINALLLSLLYRARPDELGLILIDPKILELSLYDGVPHLKVPVVSHPRQAKAVLQWAVEEMNRRYRMMQRFGVRNLDGYNRIARGEIETDDGSGAGMPRAVGLQDSVTREVIKSPQDEVSEAQAGSDGEVSETPDLSGEEADLLLDREQNAVGAVDVAIAEKLKPLPKIIIVIDELADLMLTAGREIEELITRLAQKARASGIHLIVATQRPSVDVITGLIKANFPARLSFRVSSRVDSRTILDSMGADRLLGRGDMLLMLPGAEALRRVHGAFVSDAEVKRVVDCIKQQRSPRYDERIIRICEKAMEEDSEAAARGTEGSSEEYDPVYDKAVELVMEKGHASTSMIQRVFRLGYNRAARIIETMEREGIVGPMDGVKGREVLLPRADDEAAPSGEAVKGS